MPRIKSSGPEPTYKPSTGHGHSGHFRPVADRGRKPPLPSGETAPKHKADRQTGSERRVLQRSDSSIRSQTQPSARANGSADRDTRAPLCATTRATQPRPRPKPQPQPQPQPLIDRLALSIHIDDPNEPHAPRASHERTNERSPEIVRSEWRTTGQPTTRWETLYFTACLIFKLAFIRPPPWSPAGHRCKTTPGSVSAQSLRSVSPPSGKGNAVL